MYKTIKLLETVGQNISIKQFETAYDMLTQENISEEEINNLVNSNIPLICAWSPQDDDEKETEKEEEKDNKDKKNKSDKIKKH